LGEKISRQRIFFGTAQIGNSKFVGKISRHPQIGNSKVYDIEVCAHQLHVNWVCYFTIAISKEFAASQAKQSVTGSHVHVSSAVYALVYVDAYTSKVM
jgi:hypothetical protein